MATKENIEKKIKKGEFNIKIGTTDRSYPRVIYFEGSLYVSPNYDAESYINAMNDIEKKSRRNIFNLLKQSNTIFEKNFIAIFNSSADRMKKGKYSRLTFKYFLIQPKENIKTFNELKTQVNDFVNPFTDLEKELKDCEFIVSMKKPKPAK